MAVDDINDRIAVSGGRWVNLRHKTDGPLEGAILNVETRPKTFEGKPVLSRRTGEQRVEWLFNLQTDRRDDPEDDGIRKWAAVESAQRAIAEAVRESPHKRIELGGTLKVAVTVDPPGDRDQAQYRARYTPPAAPPAGTATVEDIFGDEEAPF